MAKLAPSLKGLFASIDVLWPNRDRRTDGWYNPSSYGHGPGHNGYSHAIDVDRDGIDPMWIINHMARNNGVMWYIIWDVRVWSTTTGWNGHPYKVPKGGSLHKDHMHIEVFQTNTAEQFKGPWFVSTGGGPPGGSPPGGSPPNDSPGVPGLGVADPRDYRDSIYNTANYAFSGALKLNSASSSLIDSRNY